MGKKFSLELANKDQLIKFVKELQCYWKDNSIRFDHALLNNMLSFEPDLFTRQKVNGQIKLTMNNYIKKIALINKKFIMRKIIHHIYFKNHSIF